MREDFDRMEQERLESHSPLHSAHSAAVEIDAAIHILHHAGLRAHEETVPLRNAEYKAILTCLHRARTSVTRVSLTRA